MDRRTYKRLPTRIMSFLRGNSHEIEGQAVDLSPGGARFESGLTVHPGKVIAIRLLVPSVDAPIEIEEALVRWVGLHQFGVEFRNLDSAEREELEQLLDELDNVEGTGHA